MRNTDRVSGYTLKFSHTTVLFVVVLLMFTAGPMCAQQLTAKEILKKASAHYDAVRDYTADVKVSVDSPSIKMPEMIATIYYKTPDKLKIDSKDGLALLPRQGMVVGNPLSDLINGSGVSISGSERVLDVDCHVIKGAFKKDGRETHATVWIDKKDFLLRQMHVNPEWGQTVKVKIWYTRVARKYWMPLTTSAQVVLPPFPSMRPERDPKPKSDQPTIVTMKFSKHKVNVGLSDKLFEKK